ncbi:MAG: MlaC/ttg2D family ABC transporter substrate-binding protein [Legionella sp.]
MVAFITTMFVVQIVFAASSPVPILEKAANQIIVTLKEHQSQLKSNHELIYRAVEKNLLPIVDINGMARSVLGRRGWTIATAQEKKEFTQQFTRLVIRTYANPLAEYSGEVVKFMPLRGEINGRFTRVSSVIIRSNGQNIPLNYSLVLNNGQWKIYDLSVEGISLLQSFRSQFGQLLNNSNMKNLISEMRKKK